MLVACKCLVHGMMIALVGITEYVNSSMMQYINCDVLLYTPYVSICHTRRESLSCSMAQQQSCHLDSVGFGIVF